MSNPASVLRTGHLLNEYRVESVLGSGAFGVTYLATDTNQNVKVALKEYLPLDISTRAPDQIVSPRSKADSEIFNWGLQRFLDDARTLETVNHPNIVHVMRFFESNGSAYVIMEFIDGQPLSTWIETHRPLAQQQVLNIVGPLLDGLAVIHKAGNLHRDVKPGNVLIRADGTPVLLDFGPARAVRGDDQKMTALVSPGYAPIEQFDAHGEHGPWTDLYALGGVMYWMITGSRPTAAVARLRKDVMTPASALRLAGQPCPYTEAFLNAVDWALKPYAEDRPQSSADLVASLGIVMPEVDPERTLRIDPNSATAKAISTGMNAGTAPAADPERTLRIDPNNTLAKSISIGMSADTFTGTSAATTGTRPVTAAESLSPELLKRIEVEATRQLGPIAPIIVRGASRKATSLPELCDMVACEIDDEKARALFLKKFADDPHISPP